MREVVREGGGEEEISVGDAKEMIKKWFLERKSGDSGVGEAVWEDDESFFGWKEERRNYEEKFEEIRVGRMVRLLSGLSRSPKDLKVLSGGIAALLDEVKSLTIVSFSS